jgi:type II secretory pathway component PulF
MTLVRSIGVLAKQEKSPVLKKILLTFGSELKEGKNLSECFEMYPNSFSKAEIGVVKS